MAKFAKSNKKSSPEVSDQSREALEETVEATPSVARYLSTLKFKRATFGGVDEADVWKKIEKLCELYEESIYTERAEKKKLEQAMALIRARAAAARAKEGNADG